MSMTVKEITDWLNTMSDENHVGIDEGGLCLRMEEDPAIYCEIGGLPEEG